MSQHFLASPSLYARPGNRVRATLSTLTGQAAAAYGRYMKYRRCIREIEACSDRELCDLGIARSDIRRLALEASYGISPEKKD